MPTTSNFGWTTPADTDLVKDGALAIRTLGNGIDTSLVDLKGGTTGQILSKASNTDLDYTWINNDQGDITAVTAGTGISGGGTSGTVTITNSMATEITAAGDIIVGTGSGTFDNLPIGTTGQVLTADTTVSPYKVKWATASSGGTFSYTSYSPTFTNLTVGNGSWAYAAYAQDGKFVHVVGKFDLGSTSSVSGNITISLPVTAHSNMYGVYPAVIQADDNGVGDYPIMARIISPGTSFDTFAINAAGTYAHMYTATSSTVPFTWSSGDQINFSFVYQAA